ncbi:MAG: response regulator [Candidatus Riflebacteria bacterium]|nr:response regulator [Candidatus Riflebacteria bacterium]
MALSRPIGDGEHILLVDDSPENLDLLQQILGRQRFSLTSARDGFLALGALEQTTPDLIVLDVDMPGIDGFETCKRVRSIPRLARVPIIFLTGRSRMDDLARGFELGAVDYVTKPFDTAELLARISTHLTIRRLNLENERLLYNAIPRPIAERLKSGPGVIADRLEDVSVLFADLVRFTPMAARLAAHEVVELLNTLFTAFDRLVDAHGVEKIKTVGDSYLAAGGLPLPVPDHLDRMACLALSMRAEVERLSLRWPGLDVRIGLHAGAVVAGIIGLTKYSYDIWGDTVNTASRLESHGEPGKIHVSEVVRSRLAGAFSFEARGVVDLKGRGPMETFYLEPPVSG